MAGLKAVHLLLLVCAASVAVAQYEYSYDYSVRCDVAWGRRGLL
jgi:hypothetical protein